MKTLILLLVSLNAFGQTLKFNPFTKKFDYVSAAGAGTGDITGASNVNTVGTGLFRDKTGATLNFRGLNPASNKVTVTLNATTHTLDIDIVPGNVDLTDLNGNLAQSRITNLVSDLSAKTPTSRQIICGSGLSGCGDLSADRTLNVVNDSTQQRVGVRNNGIGSLVGTRQTIGIGYGSGFTVSDNPGSNRVDIVLEDAIETPTASRIPRADSGNKLNPGWLPNPSASTLGGVKSATCSGTNKVSAITTSGDVTCSADQNSGGASTNCAVSTSGATFTVATPCSYTAGDKKTYNLPANAVLTLSGTNGSSTAFFYAKSDGLYVGSNFGAETRSCTNCSVNPTAITDFPDDSWPIGSATYTNNSFASPTQYAFPAYQLISTGPSGNLQATTMPDGSKQLEVGSIWDIGNRKSAPFQKGLDADKPTSSCFPGMYYHSTDVGGGTLYKNNASGTCSWSAIGSGAGLTVAPIEKPVGSLTSNNGCVASSGWMFESNTLSYHSGGRCGAVWADAAVSALAYVDLVLPSTHTTGAVVPLRLDLAVGGVSGANNQVVVQRFYTRCGASGTKIADLTASSNQDISWTITDAGYGTNYTKSINLNIPGSCAANHILRVYTQRIGDSGSDTFTDTIYWAGFAAFPQ